MQLHITDSLTHCATVPQVIRKLKGGTLMQHRTRFFTKGSLFLGLGILVLFVSLAPTCRESRGPKDLEVRAKTTYSGVINGSPIRVDVLATLNTGRGGRSACTFVSLPPSFNPAVLGTLA